MLMYAIIVDDRVSVEYPSLNVIACDEPMVKSTGEGVGSVRDETTAEMTAV